MLWMCLPASMAELIKVDLVVNGICFLSDHGAQETLRDSS